MNETNYETSDIGLRNIAGIVLGLGGAAALLVPAYLAYLLLTEPQVFALVAELTPKEAMTPFFRIDTKVIEVSAEAQRYANLGFMLMLFWVLTGVGQALVRLSMVVLSKSDRALGAETAADRIATVIEKKLGERQPPAS